MSSLLKPSTRSLSTFRPQSLSPSTALSFPPTHTHLLWASFSALAYVSFTQIRTHRAFIAPALCYLPTHTPRGISMHVCEHTHLDFSKFYLPSLTLSPALLAETQNYTSVGLHFLTHSLKPSLTKKWLRARSFHKTDSYQRLQSSGPNPFRADL